MPRKSAAIGAASAYCRTVGERWVRQPRCCSRDPLYSPSDSKAAGSATRPATAQLELPIIVDRERRVIGEPPSFIDGGALDGGTQRRAYDLVVDSPTRVVVPGAAAIRPPRVVALASVTTARNASTNPRAPNRLSSQARSGGVNPG